MSDAKRKAWAKIRHGLYTDERALELSGIALALRVTLTVWALEDDEQRIGGAPAPGVGWLLTEDGDAYSVRRLARLVRFDEAVVEQALDELAGARVVVRADGGAWGIVGWCAGQEDPSAARVRAHRERQRSPSPTQPDDVTPPARYSNGPETPEERGERREERINNTDGDARAPTENPGPASGCSPVTTSTSRPSPAPVDDTHPGQRIKLTRERLCMRLDLVATRTGIPRGALDKLERGSMQPTRAELARLAEALGDPELATLPAIDGDGGGTLAERVVRELHRHQVELELAQGDPPHVTAADVRAVFAPEADDRAAGRDLLATWLTVMARAAEEIRRERARSKGRSAEFFRLDSLASENRRRKYLAAVDLDRRDPPRITQDRKYSNSTTENGT